MYAAFELYLQASALLFIFPPSPASRKHKASEHAAQQLQLPTSPDASSSSSSGGFVDASSRMIVVSWLVEVADEFGLQQESLHAAVALLDAFLAASAVSSWLILS
jgi:hypothetical protein